MLDHADNSLRAYGDKGISLSKGFLVSAKRRLLKLRILAELLIESIAVARDFSTTFEQLSGFLGYRELQRWADVGLELTKRDKGVGQSYFQTGAVKLPQLTDRQLLLVTEEPPVAKDRLGEYSDISTYCPLSRIHSCACKPHQEDEGLADFYLSLRSGVAGHSLHYVVSASLAPQFKALCDFATNYFAEHADESAKARGKS